MPRLAALLSPMLLLLACTDGTPPSKTMVDSGVLPDAYINPCDACTSAELCLAVYDGTCGQHVGCVAKTVECPDNACSPACEAAYCNAPLQCDDRIPCGTEPAGAFTCYGP